MPTSRKEPESDQHCVSQTWPPSKLMTSHRTCPSLMLSSSLLHPFDDDSETSVSQLSPHSHLPAKLRHHRPCGPSGLQWQHAATAKASYTLCLRPPRRIVKWLPRSRFRPLHFKPQWLLPLLISRTAKQPPTLHSHTVPATCASFLQQLTDRPATSRGEGKKPARQRLPKPD